MEKRQRPGTKSAAETEKSKETKNRARKLSEYGKQLEEKQKLKNMYGLRERQFRRFFDIAVKSKGAPGENLLSLLERRLDNTLYKLKLANTRTQARQVIVHGHVLVNGKKVYSPSFLVSVNDLISLAPNVANKSAFLAAVVDKRLNIGVKVPDWLELMKKEREGRVLRMPVRADITAPVEEHLIVELYSK